MTIEELQVLITGETRGLRRSLDQVKKQLGQTDREVSKVTRSINSTLRTIGATLATLGIGAFFVSATKDAMQFEAALQQINRLMGNSAATFQQWANTQANAFGFARSEAIRYGAVYANLLSTFTSDTAQTMQYTQDLLEASSIVASKTGRTMEDVMMRIRSGLLGNTEAVEDLGVNVYVNLLETTEAFRRFAGDKSWNQLDFQTQSIIRYFGILEQVSKKYGDELQANTLVRQARFVSQLKDIRLFLGQAFLPIYNAILPALTSMATALANATRFLAAFMQALFGYSQPQQAAQTADQAAAVSELGDAYEQAGKQAQGAVAGFDQVNLVGGSSPATGATTTSGGLIPTGEETDTGALSAVTGAMEDVSTRAAEMAEKVRNAFRQMSDFVKANSEVIVAAIAGIGAAMTTYLIATNWTSIIGGITGALTALRTAFTTTWAAATGPIGLVAAAIGAVVAAVIYFYQTNEQFRGFVDGIFQQIGNVAMWLWETVLQPFGVWVSDFLWHQVFEPFGNWLSTVMPIAWQAVSDAAMWLWQNVLVPLGDFLKWLWDNVLVPVGEVLSDVLGVAFEFVADVAESLWKNVLVPLGEALSEMLGPAVEAVSDVLTFLWENVLKPLAKFLGDLIKGVLSELVKIFENLWKSVLKPLAEFIGGTLMMVLDNVFGAIGDVIDGIKRAFNGLMDFISGIFTGDWKRAWEGIKDFFGGIWDGIVGLFKGAINIVIDVMNWLIRQLNKIEIDLPGWVEDLTGIGNIGINIPEIPRLATGTNYVPQDMLAVIHKGEAVVPKEYNPAAGGKVSGGVSDREVISALNRVEQAIRGLKELKAVISRSEVGRAAIDTIKDEQRRTGRLPFPV